MSPQQVPGCTVVKAARFQGVSLGARQLVTLATNDTFTLALRCCARCSQDYPAAEAYFVCIAPAGCNESRDMVSFRPQGECECQTQPRAQRGQSALEATQLDSPQSFAAGVIVRDTTPFSPLADVQSGTGSGNSTG